MSDERTTTATELEFWKVWWQVDHDGHRRRKTQHYVSEEPMSVKRRFDEACLGLWVRPHMEEAEVTDLFQRIYLVGDKGRRLNRGDAQSMLPGKLFYEPEPAEGELAERARALVGRIRQHSTSDTGDMPRRLLPEGMADDPEEF